MALQQIPLVGSQFLAGLIQSGLAASKLRLFVAGYQPNLNDTLADLVAVEATFSGYPAGGYSLATWSAALFNPVGGSQTVAPQTDVLFTAPGSGSPVTQTLGGWFLVSSGGILVADGLFDTPIPMVQNGDGFPITMALFAGTVNALVQSWVYGSEQ